MGELDLGEVVDAMAHFLSTVRRFFQSHQSPPPPQLPADMMRLDNLINFCIKKQTTRPLLDKTTLPSKPMLSY